MKGDRARRYLRKLREDKAEISRLKSEQQDLLDHIAQLRSAVTSIKAVRYDKEKIQASAGNALEDAIVHIEEVEERHQQKVKEYICRINEYQRNRQTITEQIDAMEDCVHRQILTAIYINERSMVSTAMNLIRKDGTRGMSVDWCKHLHTNALMEFEKKWMRKQ